MTSSATAFDSEKISPGMSTMGSRTLRSNVPKYGRAIAAPKGLPRDQLEALALASEKVQRFLDGAQVRKVIVVPDRLVNIVA